MEAFIGIQLNQIQSMINEIRGHKVMLYYDLGQFYEVEAKDSLKKSIEYTD